MTFTPQELALSDESFIDCLNEKLIKLSSEKTMENNEKLIHIHKLLSCIEQLTDQVMLNNPMSPHHSPAVL
jgi:hypothetical protein